MRYFMKRKIQRDEVQYDKDAPQYYVPKVVTASLWHSVRHGIFSPLQALHQTIVRKN